jgi:hypothetical protein
LTVEEGDCGDRGGAVQALELPSADGEIGDDAGCEGIELAADTKGMQRGNVAAIRPTENHRDRQSMRISKTA